MKKELTKTDEAALEILRKKESNQEEKLGDAIDFSRVYRVRGQKGLFIPCSKTNKAGIVGMMKMDDYEDRGSYSAKDCLCLLSYFFVKNDLSRIGMPEVFNNLQKLSDNKIVMYQTERDLLVLMEAMCPDYNKAQFKSYHAKQVVAWYNYVLEIVSSEDTVTV